jgi:hypothetical protein
VNRLGHSQHKKIQIELAMVHIQTLGKHLHELQRLGHSQHKKIQIELAMLCIQTLGKHLHELQVVLLLLLGLELDWFHLEQLLLCLLASVALHQVLLVEELVLSIQLSPEFNKE